MVRIISALTVFTFLPAICGPSATIIPVPKPGAEVKEVKHVKDTTKKATKQTHDKVSRIIKAQVGETFFIDLPSSPKIGRTWELKNLPKSITLVSQKPEFVEKPTKKHEGIDVYSFKGSTPGHYYIQFHKVHSGAVKKDAATKDAATKNGKAPAKKEHTLFKVKTFKVHIKGNKEAVKKEPMPRKTSKTTKTVK